MLRLGEAQVHVRHLEDRALVHLLHKRGQELLQFIQGRGLQYVLDRHTAPASAEGGLLLYEARAKVSLRTSFDKVSAISICERSRSLISLNMRFSEPPPSHERVMMDCFSGAMESLFARYGRVVADKPRR